MLKTRSLIAGITLLTLSLACGSQVGLAAGANYESAECKSYINSLTQKLNNNWYIPDGKNKVTVTCTLESDGTAQDVVTVSVPGSPEAEQAANTAFVQAQPFGALPSSAGEKAKLTLDFVSSADPHGDSSRQINASLSPPKR